MALDDALTEGKMKKTVILENLVMKETQLLEPMKPSVSMAASNDMATLIDTEVVTQSEYPQQSITIKYY